MEKYSIKEKEFQALCWRYKQIIGKGLNKLYKNNVWEKNNNGK